MRKFTVSTPTAPEPHRSREIVQFFDPQGNPFSLGDGGGGFDPTTPIPELHFSGDPEDPTSGLDINWDANVVGMMFDTPAIYVGQPGEDWLNPTVYTYHNENAAGLGAQGLDGEDWVDIAALKNESVQRASINLTSSGFESGYRGAALGSAMYGTGIPYDDAEQHPALSFVDYSFGPSASVMLGMSDDGEMTLKPVYGSTSEPKLLIRPNNFSPGSALTPTKLQFDDVSLERESDIGDYGVGLDLTVNGNDSLLHLSPDVILVELDKASPWGQYAYISAFSVSMNDDAGGTWGSIQPSGEYRSRHELANSFVLAPQLLGATQNLFLLQADGSMRWGDGVAVPDISLQREDFWGDFPTLTLRTNNVDGTEFNLIGLPIFAVASDQSTLAGLNPEGNINLRTAELTDQVFIVNTPDAVGMQLLADGTLIGRAADGNRYKLVPPVGGGPATWVAA